MNLVRLIFYCPCVLLAAALWGTEPGAPSLLVENVTEKVREELAKKNVDLRPERLPCFGSNLFLGNFSKRSVQDFSPDYQISIGDQITLHIWGAMSFSSELVVDTQGNIFVPTVGPIAVLNVKNENLNRVVDEAIRRHYRDNVRVYALLAAAKPVSVYVSGFVLRPGNYDGVCSETVLHFIDRAGGVDPEKGSFLDIQLLREGKVIASFDLYQFLLHGRIESRQLRNGDVILVGPRRRHVYISGEVQHANAFEFQGKTIPLSALLGMAIPHPGATYVLRTHREKGEVLQSRLELVRSARVEIQDGDMLEVGSEHLAQQVRVTLTGEFEGDATLVLDKSCTLQELFDRNLIRASVTGDIRCLQLLRKSEARKQKDMIEKSLSQLERQMLFSAPVNSEEAHIRVEEAKIFEKFITRAREVDPLGLVVMEEDGDCYDKIYLEDGDILHIPAKAYTVVVSGSVRLPMTFAYDERKTVADYIRLAGGLSKEADHRGILIIHPNGASRMLGAGIPMSPSPSRRRGREIAPRPNILCRETTPLSPGDTIMVLPKVTTSSMLLAQSVADILYKVAIVTRTILKW